MHLDESEFPLQDIQAALSESIHAPEREEDIHRLSQLPFVQTCTCFSRFGHCVQAPFHELAKACARQLAHQTCDRNLAAGTLVKITPLTPAGFQLTGVMYFLGALCKKPLVHVLARAIEANRHIFCFVPKGTEAESIPEFMTSHQLFQSLLEMHSRCDGGLELTDFQVDVLSSSFPHHWRSVEHLEVRALHVTATFVISGAPQTQTAGSRREKEAPISLPFGLQPRPKHPKPKHGKQRQAGQGRSQQKGPAKARRRSVQSVHSSSSSSSSSSLDLRPSTTPGPSGSSSDAGDSDLNAADAGVEVMAAPTATAVLEQQVVEREFELFLETRQQKAAAAERYATTGEAPKGSYFVQAVGFEAASIAPSSRAICYHCNQKIDKGTIRFSYFYSTKKPSRSIHEACIIPFVQADRTGARMQQGVKGLLDIVQSLEGHGTGASSSSAPDRSLILKNASQKLLTEILQLSG